MLSKFTPSRRDILRTGAAGLTVGALGSAIPLSRAFAADITVGFIYVGPATTRPMRSAPPPSSRWKA
jgi:simple sugar transport system substrate-binding protein